jgi:hypothetical protein
MYPTDRAAGPTTSASLYRAACWSKDVDGQAGVELKLVERKVVGVDREDVVRLEGWRASELLAGGDSSQVVTQHLLGLVEPVQQHQCRLVRVRPYACRDTSTALGLSSGSASGYVEASV